MSDNFQIHARLTEVERRVTGHDQKLDTLTEKVAEFVGAAKNTNRVLALVVAIAAVAQLLFTLFHK